MNQLAFVQRLLFVFVVTVVLTIMLVEYLKVAEDPHFVHKSIGTGETQKRNDVLWFPTSNVCDDILHNSNTTFKQEVDLTEDWDVVQRAESCNIFKKNYKFVLNESSAEERLFSIAYSILVHQNVHQLVLLLSSIYTTHNYYCIHVDAKAERKTWLAAVAVSGCFKNIFVMQQRKSVIYAGISRLQADLNCFQDLLRFRNWKYLINLCGQDFPLQTNWELVRQLKALNETNVIPGTIATDYGTLQRTRFIYRIANSSSNDGYTKQHLIRTDTKHTPPPFNLTVRKNLAYNFFTRPFVKWALEESKMAKELLTWSHDTYSPDEHYWSMLNALPDAPGGRPSINWWSVVRYIRWMYSPLEKCNGYVRHRICVFGTKDVHSLTQRHETFVNKVDAKYDVNVISCLRQWLDERRMGLNNSKNPRKIPMVPTWVKKRLI